MSDVLKPCPFCGCKARVVLSQDLQGRTWYWAACCHVYRPHESIRHASQEALEQDWNSRDGERPYVEALAKIAKQRLSSEVDLPMDLDWRDGFDTAVMTARQALWKKR